jgi:4,5-dihydroxyphthalate decarboxylase
VALVTEGASVMTRLNLTFATCKYDRMDALQTGDVHVQGVDLNVLTFPAGREIFDRMVGGLEFDASELSSSEYISMAAHGNCPFVALPVFPSRVFRHGYIFVNRRAGIREPKDLEGRRVGVPLYTQTAAIWIRGHLAHEFGVDLASIRWVQGSVEKPGAHGTPHAKPLLQPVPIEQNTSGRSLSELLARGEIEAYIGSRKPACFGRDPYVARLLPNYKELERILFLTKRIFPIMHLVVIRRDVYERHTWLAGSLYKAFVESKRRALSRMRYVGSLSCMLPWLSDAIEEVDEVFGGDAWPYGIDANRPTLEALVAYMVEQHFIPAALPIDQLFAPILGQLDT